MSLLPGLLAKGEEGLRRIDRWPVWALLFPQPKSGVNLFHWKPPSLAGCTFRFTGAPVIHHVHQLFTKQTKWKPTA